MNTKELFSEADKSEIENAADLCGISFDDFVKRSTIWVLFNYPEAISKKRNRIDKQYRCIV